MELSAAPEAPGRSTLVWPRRTPAGAVAGAAGLAFAAAARSHVRWRRRTAAARARYAYEDPGLPTQVGPLAARVSGAHGRPVLLIHGLAGSSRSWSAAYDRALASGHRLVVPDLLGFGRSPRPGGPRYALEEQADLLAETMAAAGADDQPAVVGTHSFGVLVALALQRRHPRLVAGIVAASPPIFRDAAHARRSMLRALTPVERIIAMDTEWARRTCTALCCRRPRLAVMVARVYRRDLPVAMAVDGVAHTWHSYSSSLAELLGARARPEWAIEAGVPLHLLYGGRDPLPDPAYLGELAASSSLVQVELVDDADHVLHLPHSARCIALLVDMGRHLDPSGSAAA